MKPEEWVRLKELLWAALQREPSQRSAFLRDACGNDESLRAEVESLLASYDRPIRFIDNPLVPSSHVYSEALVGRRVGTYQLIGEIGRGGMSTVYLARDLRHERQVALKVLSPELAATLGPERFLREIRVTAQLQHPHILPLHDSGELDGLLYYVMPYVEGESLRARLIREGHLPLAQALAITCEVADALGYAHSHDVVHRDIKPENILLSGGHALVADFGIARAITAAGGDVVTQTGLAIGTPGYMSPEQASGSRQLDRRSDIYSLGCVLYEMLAGESPLVGLAREATAANVLSERVPHLSGLRDAPKYIERAVTKALARAPADRFATAAQFAQALSTVAPGPAAVPLKAGVLFAAASVGILAVVYLVVMGLGLPDWVLTAAAGLVIAGLPVILATALAERRRAIARTAGFLGARVPGEPYRWLTWRRALLGGVLAFAALGLGAAVYVVMRALGVAPVGTLVANGVLSERDRLVLTAFQNRTSDTTLGLSVTEALRVDLTQSRVARLLDAATITDALRRMNRDPGTELGVGIARELAQREGAKAVVAGRIDRAGSGYLLSAELISATRGEELVALRETAKDNGAIINAVDRLSARLRGRIGESLRTIRASEPLERVTSASLEALRKYSQAVRANEAGQPDRAVALLEEAITLDTGFAMAYRKLGVILSNVLAARSRVVAATTKAFEHRDRLPALERYLTAAWYYETVVLDANKVAAAYRSVLEIDPDNILALNNLARLMNEHRRWQEAESLALRGLAVGHFPPLYVNAYQAEVAQGRLPEAGRTVALFTAWAPGHPEAALMRIDLAAGQRHFDSAATYVRSLARSQHGLHYRWVSAFELFALDGVRGQLRAAESNVQQFLAVSEEAHLPQAYIRGQLSFALLLLRYRNAPVEALRRVETALQRHPLRSIAVTDRPYLQLAAFYAEAGRPERGKALLADYEREVPERLRQSDAFRHATAAALALAERRFQAAIVGYRAFYAESACATCGLWELGQTYERAGAPDSAASTYERAVNTLGVSRFVDEFATLPNIYRRLGELYEVRGNRTKALEYYSRFVDLWRGADPELQPIVRDVRTRIGRLAGER